MPALFSGLRRKFIPAMQHQMRKLHELDYLFFELTHRCNLECLHCGSDCRADSGLPDLAADTVLDVLRQVRERYNPLRITVALSGGEPLCYPGVFELGRQISALEFPWGMVTNGYGWDLTRLKKAKAAGMRSVTVSLDGLEEAHDWLRGKKGSYQRALYAIRLLASADFLQGMDVITCANQRNLGQLAEMADLLAAQGVTQWRIFTISPIGRAPQYPELFLQREQYAQLLDTIAGLKERSDIKVRLSESGYLGRQHELRVRDSCFFCKAGISTAGVMINADMLACPNIDRRFAQGNVLKDNFVEVWEHQYKNFRDRRWLKTDRCAGCSEWSYCQGGPFHLRAPDSAAIKLCHYHDFAL